MVALITQDVCRILLEVTENECFSINDLGRKISGSLPRRLTIRDLSQNLGAREDKRADKRCICSWEVIYSISSYKTCSLISVRKRWVITDKLAVTVAELKGYSRVHIMSTEYWVLMDLKRRNENRSYRHFWVKYGRKQIRNWVKSFISVCCINLVRNPIDCLDMTEICHCILFEMMSRKLMGWIY